MLARVEGIAVVFRSTGFPQECIQVLNVNDVLFNTCTIVNHKFFGVFKNEICKIEKLF